MQNPTTEEVLRIARRAGLTFDDMELRQIWPIVQRYLDGLAKLQAVDLSEEPLGAIFHPERVGERR